MAKKHSGGGWEIVQKPPCIIGLILFTFFVSFCYLRRHPPGWRGPRPAPRCCSCRMPNKKQGQTVHKRRRCTERQTDLLTFFTETSAKAKFCGSIFLVKDNNIWGGAGRALYTVQLLYMLLSVPQNVPQTCTA